MLCLFQAVSLSVSELDCLSVPGCISVSEWALVVESVLRLDLPWRTLRPRLAQLAPDGRINYQSCFEDMGPGQPIAQVRTRKRLIDQLIDVIW